VGERRVAYRVLVGRAEGERDHLEEILVDGEDNFEINMPEDGLDETGLW
jgi:hypothetical protein